MGGPYDKSLDYSGDFYQIEGYGLIPKNDHKVQLSGDGITKILNNSRVAYYVVVDDEIERATKKFGPFHSAMEGQAIVAEEFDEFTHAVRHETKERAREEAVQLAAMAIRFLMDVK